MQCARCLHRNAAGFRFCEACGVSLLGSCPACNAECSTSASFCGACGAKLPFSAARDDDLLARDVSEYRRTTVLFADIANSTAFISTLDPEQAMQRLQPALSAMAEAIGRFDGTVVRTMGDGLFALFGAPKAQEGHAILACKAAIALRGAFSDRADGLRIRIGLHSGKVVVGLQSAGQKRSQVEAHGMAIHVASRLERLAEPGEAVMSRECEALVSSHLDTVRLGTYTLKGVPEPVEVYRLVGLKRSAIGLRLGEQSLLPLRGRNTELSILEEALASVDKGVPRVVGINGASGTGKSRLCLAFAAWCSDHGIPVHDTHAEPYGHATPFELALGFFRSLLEIEPAADIALAKRRIAESLGKIGPTFDADCSLLGEFLGYPGEKDWGWLTASARKARLLEIARHLIRQIGKSLSVIIIEDLHWCDEASKDFLEIILLSIVGTKCLLILNYRESYFPVMSRPEYFEEIALKELSDDAAAAVVHDLVGHAAELEDVRELIIERSAGNPFFAEELVRSLVSTGTLQGQTGSYTRGVAPVADDLPITVQDVIASRIDHLPEIDRSLLQVGAVIGKEFPSDLLNMMVDIDCGENEAALGRLCDADMIQLRDTASGRRYSFRHPLIQEVCYKTQLRTTLKHLHARAAAAIQTLYSSRLDENAGLLAHHYAAAGEMVNAARSEARAARWVGSTSSAAAMRHWRKVSQHLLGHPRTVETDRLQILANGQIAWLGWREGMTANEARPYLDEALRRAREIDDTLIPLLLFVEARLIGAGGGPADAYVDGIQKALALVPETYAERRSTLNASLCQGFGWAGQCADALAAGDQALDGLRPESRFDRDFLGYSVENWVISLRGRILVNLARFDEARICFDRMLAVERSLMDPTVRFISHLGYIDIARRFDDAALAREHADAVAALAKLHDSPYLRVFRHACLGIAHTIAGDFPAGMSEFSAGLAFMRSANAALDYEAELLVAHAECCHTAGDNHEALRLATEALVCGKRLQTKIPQLRAEIVCGGALLHLTGRHGVDDARAHFGSAAALIERTGAVVYEPFLAKEVQRLDQFAEYPGFRASKVNSRRP